MKLSIDLAGKPALQKKILELILENEGEETIEGEYDFSDPEVFKGLSDKLKSMLTLLAKEDQSLENIRSEFGESYYVYFSHITRRIVSIFNKKGKEWGGMIWSKFEDEKYSVSDEAKRNIKKYLEI
jgi:hypothetical protein